MNYQIIPGLLLEKRWRVVEAIATGGFGQTFKVVDTDETPKVLKVLNLDKFSDNEGKQKAISLFKKEAEVLNKLSHPGIPKVEKDAYFTYRPPGKLEPFHCLIMELIEGKNLEDWMEARKYQPISEFLALDWLKQLAEILNELHQQSYFHRDIKPSNIMLKPDGKLVLIDFGTVRENSLTYLGKVGRGNDITIIKSSGYTSPEQWEGTAVPQSDFFALGRTLVYLLTGQHPLNFKDAKTEELKWRESAPLVSELLADLIDDLMAIAPGKRPQNATIILQRLTTVSLAKPKIFEKRLIIRNVRRFVVSNKVKLSVAASLILGFTGLSLMSENIAFALNEIGYKNLENRKILTASRFFSVAVKLNPEFGMARYNLGFACEEQNNFNCAVEEYGKAIFLNEYLSANRARSNLARLYLVRDKNYEVAINLIQPGLQQTREINTKATLLKNLGWAYLLMGSYPEAEKQLLESINLSKDLAEAHCLLGEVREQMGDKEGAIASFKECLSLGSEDIIWTNKAREYLALDVKKPD